MLVTEVTEGSFATWASIGVTFSCTAPSRTEPSRTCTTIWSLSPACWGADDSSSTCALADSAPGRVKALE